MGDDDLWRKMATESLDATSTASLSSVASLKLRPRLRASTEGGPNMGCGVFISLIVRKKCSKGPIKKRGMSPRSFFPSRRMCVRCVASSQDEEGAMTVYIHTADGKLIRDAKKTYNSKTSSIKTTTAIDRENYY